MRIRNLKKFDGNAEMKIVCMKVSAERQGARICFKWVYRTDMRMIKRNEIKNWIELIAKK